MIQLDRYAGDAGKLRFVRYEDGTVCVGLYALRNNIINNNEKTT